MAYSLKKREQARDLFVEFGMSYRAIAKKSGISASILKKWGIENDWVKQRREFGRASEAVSEKSRRLELLTYHDLITGLRSGRMQAHDVHARLAVLRTVILQKIINGAPGLIETVRRLERVSDLLGKIKRR